VHSSAIDQVISRLKLLPLEPEGGFFVQTFQATEVVATARGNRPASTAIYYLLTRETISRLHLLHQTEVWHFYFGDPVIHESWNPNAALSLHRVVLGHAIHQGEVPQLVVPAGSWQTAQLAPTGPCGFALLGATMSPGFSFEDFELAGPSTPFPTEIALAWREHLSSTKAVPP